MDINAVSLRCFTPQDQENMLQLLVSNVNKTYMLPDFACEEDAIPLFRKLHDLSHDPARYVRCIDLDGTAVGFINDVVTENGRIELGYVVHPLYHGRGIMTAALKLALTEVFSKGFATITCGAFEENPASMRVMEKCGMKRVDFTEIIEYRGKGRLCIYYEITKEDHHA